MFDGEHRIALHTMKGIWASSHGEWEVSWLFSSSGRILGYILDLLRGWPLKTTVGSATSRLLSCYVGHLRNLFEAWQSNTDPSLGEARDPGSLSSCHRILGFLSICKKTQASSPFEALNSPCLSRCQRDVGPPVEMRRGTRAFSRVPQGIQTSLHLVR